VAKRRSIAIFGSNQVAVEVASSLRGGDHRILVVDKDPDQLRLAEGQGLQTIAIDYRDDDALAELALGKEIDSVFCLFTDDAENVFLTLSIRALAPEVRIFSIAHGRSSVPNLRAAGADKVIETRQISGLRIWDIITRPIVVGILDRTLFGQADLNLAEIPLPDRCFLIGRGVVNSGLERDYDLMVLGMVDENGDEHFLHSPTAQDKRLAPGDMLLVIGPTRAIEMLRNDLEAATSP
jgi:voltage-gated potassium channel